MLKPPDTPIAEHLKKIKNKKNHFPARCLANCIFLGCPNKDNCHEFGTQKASMMKHKATRTRVLILVSMLHLLF